MKFRPTTRAAEGLPRRAFTVEEVDRMVVLGLMDEHERVELLGGDLLPMAPKGYAHERLKIALSQFLILGSPERFRVIPATTFRLSKDTFLEPDFLVFTASVSLRDVRAPDAALVIEVADSSLEYDLGHKPKIYSKFGIVELWVINAENLTTHVHREPTAAGYAQITVQDGRALLTPLLVPELALELGLLDLGP